MVGTLTPRFSVVLASVVLAGVALCADFYQGLDAYERGDFEVALRHWKPLAEQGDPEAQYRIARMYYHGRGVQDDAEAARWYREAADRGHAKARNNLGMMYERGRGVAQDVSAAVEWYRLAAEQRLPTAQANLARMYDTGRGAPQSSEQAAGWYRRAARAGHAASQYRLAQMYDEGRGVPRDTAKATKWYRKAAAGGYSMARRALAARPPDESRDKDKTKRAGAPEPTTPPVANRSAPESSGVSAGDGPTGTSDTAPDDSLPVVELPPVVALPPDAPLEAAAPGGSLDDPLRDLRESAESGDAEAQYRLAMSFTKGDVVAIDRSEAGRWLLEAARGGHGQAAYRVGFMYLRGNGIAQRKDYVQAYKWLSVAADLDVGDAATWCEKIADKMTDAELAESTSLVREWHPR
jgi:TPR repeat protein